MAQRAALYILVIAVIAVFAVEGGRSLALHA
jgi:hypothetical protein